MNSIAEVNKGFEENMAFPQYKDAYGSHIVISTDTLAHLQIHVLELSNRKGFGACAEVRKHFDSILAGIVPFGMRVVEEI